MHFFINVITTDIEGYDLLFVYTVIKKGVFAKMKWLMQTIIYGDQY